MNKSEIRISKFETIQKFKSLKSKIVLSTRILYFEFVSYFGFRASSLNTNRGFTLMEMLIVVSIIGILITLSIFTLTGVRANSRDTVRKSTLQAIRGALETYRSDCSKYPATSDFPAAGGQLIGDNSSGSCSQTNVYIPSRGADPQPAKYQYVYSRTSPSAYVLCAYLEQGAAAVASGCSGVNCGASTSIACNYSVKND